MGTSVPFPSPPPACVRFLPSLSCPSSLYKPSTSRYQATCETPNSSSEQSKNKKNVKKNIETDDLVDSLCALRKIFALRIWLEETLVKLCLGKLCASKLTAFPKLLYRKIFWFLRTDKAVVYIFYVTQQKGYQNTLTRLPGVIISVLLILACPP